MKILYDYQALTMQKYGGVSRYFYEIIKRLDQRSDCDVKLVAPFSVNYYFEDYFHKKSLNKFSSFEKQRWAERVDRIFTKLELGKKYDIIHPTYYDPYILNYKESKLVVTIHDMIYEIFPEVFGSSIDTMIETKRQHIFAADHIIAVSENTKKDILRFYPDVSPQKITVIYHGNSLNTENINEKLSIELPEQYVLFVGNRGGYKNFDNFIKAMAIIMKEQKDLFVVAGGGGNFSTEEVELFKELNIKDRIKQIYYTDEELAAVYNKAICFVFPSQYEGFGIPILEAWAAKCPIAISNASCFPEIAGDAALYFDPLDINDISQKIGTLIEDEALRNELVKKSTNNLSKYNWDYAAEKTLKVYSSLL